MLTLENNTCRTKLIQLSGLLIHVIQQKRGSCEDRMDLFSFEVEIAVTQLLKQYIDASERFPAMKTGYSQLQCLNITSPL